jgi:hypothetical protein
MVNYRMVNQFSERNIRCFLQAVSRVACLQSEVKSLRESVSGHGHRGIHGAEELRNLQL